MVLHLHPSLPQTPFAHRPKRSNPSSHPRGVAEIFMEKPSPSLRFSSHLSDSKDSQKLKSLNLAKQIHTHFVKKAAEPDSHATTSKLIRMYAETGDFQTAAVVLLMGFEGNSLSWRALLEEFENDGGRSHELLVVVRELHRKGMIFDDRILNAFLRICTSLMDYWLGSEIHSCMIKTGFDSDFHLKCALMEFYADCCGFEHAEKLFDEIDTRNPLLWKEAIMLNFRDGLLLKGLELFRRMQSSFAEADNFIIAKVLQACGKLEAIEQGQQIHGYVIRSGWLSDSLICNSLISMYSRNSKLDLARMVFELMSGRNSVSWNSMIAGYAFNGLIDEALRIFHEMELSDTKPDVVTWNSLLSGCFAHSSYGEILKVLRRMQIASFRPNSSSITTVLQAVSESGSLGLGKEIHGYVIRNGLDDDIYVVTSLIDMYVKKVRLAYARSIFNNMIFRNIFAWNSLISGYAYNGYFDEALELLNEMEKDGIKPDLVTWNGLISGYAKRGLSKEAMVLIRHLKSLGLSPNVVSWTALISGCSRTGNYSESLNFFTQMQQEGIEPNSVTVASSLRACAALALLQKGAELHCFAIRNGFDEDIFVATALIDMYCKSGCLRNAQRVFGRIHDKNLACWNAMIMGFAAHGLGKESISLFNEMRELGIHPDGITFTALLSGCRHSGLLDEGWKYFDGMREYGLNPTLEHYACMVDLLGRGGYLDEAWDFLRTMPLEPDAIVWGSLLGACRIHKNLELAEIAAENLFKLEPDNYGNYLLMMDLYAAMNQWEAVENLRAMMNVVGLKNRPGWSWVQINQRVHIFSVEGKPHLDIGEIYFELYQLLSEIRKIGYVPDTNCIVQNVSKEEKEKLLLSHTEKLAITYGLINTEKGASIRVIKNTRVCNDCHTMAKYISRITCREIFLRDGVRFHHFIDGKCSCNDYW